jgi:hypothetical protein
MFNGGRQLKRARLDSSLTLRDVEHLSRILSAAYGDDRYAVRISVLSDIENHSRAPSIFRLHSLCLIYSLNMSRVLEWFGVWPKASERSTVQGYVRWRTRPTKLSCRR